MERVVERIIILKMEANVKTVAIIQARTSSTRLPGKVLMDLGGKPILINILERVERSRKVDEVVVATSDESSDDKIVDLLTAHNTRLFRGSLNNVLERFYLCAKNYAADVVIRLTADNALVAPEIIDEAVDFFLGGDIDYLYYKKSLPLGMCIEVFSFAALEKAYKEATDSECLEHVTPYIRNNRSMFRVMNYSDDSGVDHSDLRFTIDTPEDYEFVSKIYDSFESNGFSYKEILDVIDYHPEWKRINQGIEQNVVNYSGESNRKNI